MMIMMMSMSTTTASIVISTATILMTPATPTSAVLQNVLINRHVDRIWMGHGYFNFSDHFNREWFLYFDGVGFLDGVRYRLLDNLGYHLVDWHLNRMLNRYVDGVRLRNLHIHIVWHSHRYR